MRRNFLNFAICIAAFFLGTLAVIGFFMPKDATNDAPAEMSEAPSDASKPVITETANQSNESRFPIIEIWKELEGSVPISGKSLYFRMYNDGAVDFEYQLRKENESGKPRYTYFLERTPAAKISENESQKFKSLSEDLIKSKDIKQEYKTVALTFDVFTKLTILLKENDAAERKIIINDSEYDVMSCDFEKKFPKSVVELIREVDLMRTNLKE